MTTKTAYVNEQAIRAEYAPYDTMHAFEIGFTTRQQGRSWIRHHYRGVDEQAYDRGVEAASRIERAHAWVGTNVGQN